MGFGSECVTDHAMYTKLTSLQYNGQAGVELGLRILLEEFRSVMALAGCRTVNQISLNHLSVLEYNGILAKL